VALRHQSTAIVSRHTDAPWMLHNDTALQQRHLRREKRKFKIP
jgi:hypothetical protein